MIESRVMLEHNRTTAVTAANKYRDRWRAAEERAKRYEEFMTGRYAATRATADELALVNDMLRKQLMEAGTIIRDLKRGNTYEQDNDRTRVGTGPGRLARILRYAQALWYSLSGFDLRSGRLGWIYRWCRRLCR